MEGARPCAAEVAVAVAADKSRGGERGQSGEAEAEASGGVHANPSSPARMQEQATSSRPSSSERSSSSGGHHMEARERKKAYLNDLEVKVKDLEKKNSELEERFSTLQNENQMLRQILKNTTVSRRGPGSTASGEGQ